MTHEQIMKNRPCTTGNGKSDFLKQVGNVSRSKSGKTICIYMDNELIGFIGVNVLRDLLAHKLNRCNLYIYPSDDKTKEEIKNEQ